MLPSTPLPARIFRVGRISRQNGLSARARWQSGELQGERGWESFSPRLPTTSPDGQKPLPVGGIHALRHDQRPPTVVDSVRVYDINESAESIIPTRDINVLQLPVTSQHRCFAHSKQIIAIVRVVRKLYIGHREFLDMVQFKRNAETAAVSRVAQIAKYRYKKRRNVKN